VSTLRYATVMGAAGYGRETHSHRFGQHGWKVGRLRAADPTSSLPTSTHTMRCFSGHRRRQLCMHAPRLCTAWPVSQREPKGGAQGPKPGMHY